MAIKDFFVRNKDRPFDGSIPTGRVSNAKDMHGIASPYHSRTKQLLTELRSIPDEANAIEYLSKKHPDMSMSLWNYMRLSNQGHKMEFYGVTGRQKGKRITDIEDEWREFSARINTIGQSGLDGLIDIFHKNALQFGNQMCEVEVDSDLTDIVDVYPIDPRTVTWEQENRNGKYVWVPYQNGTFGNKIDLSKGNFINIPLDPDSGKPNGNLMFTPAIQSIDFQLQSYYDMSAVLRRQGYPRNDIEISRESVLKSAPSSVKTTEKETKNYLEKYFDFVVGLFSKLDPTQDYVHFDDTKIGKAGGGDPSRSMDIRAYNEMTDIQSLNGLKTLGTLANRHAGKTETFSTVELKIMVEAVKSLQRGSKRLVENIAYIWLRVKGYQAKPVFTHNPVDWQSEIDKWTVSLMKEQYYANAQGMQWVSPDEAAQGAVGVKKAFGNVSNEKIPISFDYSVIVGKSNILNQKEGENSE